MSKNQAYEIEVFAMHGDHLAQREESVEYYDILVRAEPGDDGDIEIIEEIEDLSEDEMNTHVSRLEAKHNLQASYVGGPN